MVATIFLQWHSYIVILLEFSSTGSSHILHNYRQTQSVKNTVSDKDISAPRCWSHKEYSCFDFPIQSMIIFDVFWVSLGTSIFGNSSLATTNTWSRPLSRLSFCCLWLWLGQWLFQWVENRCLIHNLVAKGQFSEFTSTVTYNLYILACLIAYLWWNSVRLVHNARNWISMWWFLDNYYTLTVNIPK